MTRTSFERGSAGRRTAAAARGIPHGRDAIATALLAIALLATAFPTVAAVQSPTPRTTPVDPLVEAAWLLDRIDDDDVVVLQ